MKTLSSIRNPLITENTLLRESLDSPVEITITDDTRLPQAIYGIYELDGVQYGMSLEESDFPRVYILRQYRIVNQKVRLWSYTKASHFRPSLATLLKFCESSIPFLQTKMDGIIIQLPGKLQSEALNGLLERIVKKSYIKTFRSVRVMSNDKQQAYNYAFIIRKTKSPQTLFASKFFSKYSFVDLKPGDMPVEAAQDIKPKKKVEKVIVSVKPSPKYQFKGYEVQNAPVDSVEVVKKIVDNEPKVKILSPEEAEVQHEHPVAPPKKDPLKPEELPPKPEPTPPPKEPTHLDNEKLAIGLMTAMPSMAQKIQQYGFDETKFDSKTFAYVLNKLKMSGQFMHLPKIFIANKWLENDGYDNGLTLEGIKKTKTLLMMIDKMYKDKTMYMDGKPTKVFLNMKSATIKSLSDWQNHYDKLIDAENDYQKKLDAWNKVVNPGLGKKSEQFTKGGMSFTPQTSYEKHVAMIDENADFSALVSDLPGSGEYVFTNYQAQGYEVGENTETKMKEIYAKGYGNYGSMSKKGVKTENQKYVKAYTGSSYDYYNGTLREAFNDVLLGEKDESSMKLNQYKWSEYGEKVRKMQEAFKQIEPIDFNMWVYRGSSLPSVVSPTNLHPGKFYVDPGFLSCAVHSTNTFGMGNLKMRIFIPKGSRVIPVLNESTHSSEREVILPASSVLKIIRYDKLTSKYGDNFHHITCVYTGTVFDDLYTKYKEKYNLKEAKKPTPSKKGYDANKKFAGNPYNLKTNKKITDMIKKGEITPKK